MAPGQDLLGGEVVHSGRVVSILFVDRTVMRPQRDSERVVHAVSPDAAGLRAFILFRFH
jgi:hypothetical protein